MNYRDLPGDGGRATPSPEGEAGGWFVRRYVGKERYRVATIGLADDLAGAEASRALTFAEAQRLALARELAADSAAPKAQAVTVADVVADYVKWLKVHRASAHDAEDRAANHILPTLSRVKVEDLTREASARAHRRRDRDDLRVGFGATDGTRGSPATRPRDAARAVAPGRRSAKTKTRISPNFAGRDRRRLRRQPGS